MDSREKLLLIGDYPSISLMESRRIKDAARADVASGVNPNEAKQDTKRRRNKDISLTFEKQADAFFAKSVKEGKAEATLAKSEWLLSMAKADFGPKAISEITSPMVLKCLRKVEAKGNYETARRLRAKIGAVFRYAIANGVAEVDPTFALRDALIRPTVKSRSAITDPKKLGGHFRGY